jgi:biotin carboxyl carrier protein
MMRHLRITVDGRAYDVVVEDLTQTGAVSTTTPMPGPLVPPVGSPPAPMAASPVAGTGGSSGPGAAAPPTAGGPDDRVSPLAGVVVEVSVKVGDTVEVDDQIVVLEAMKMKTVIGAHKSGRITAVHVREGDAVDADQPLVTIS